MLILANEIETIAQTLDNLMSVDLPRLVILFGLLLIAVIIIIVLAFWRILNNYSRADSQQLQLTAQTMTNLNEYLRTERETNRVKLDVALQEIRESHKVVMNSITMQNSAIEGLAARIKEIFSILDSTIEKIEQRAINDEAKAMEQRQKVISMSEGLQKDMGEVKDGNQEILIELRKLTAEVKRLSDIMQGFATVPESINEAMQGVTQAVNKLTQTNPTVKPETSSEEPEAKA